MLNIGSLHDASIDELAEIIKPAGFQRIKATRIKNFIRRLIEDFYGQIDILCTMNIRDIRAWLLDIPGIGRETADNIILYACGKTIFPVDKYTIRLFSRLGITQSTNYDYVRGLVEKNIPRNVEIYKEFRALIVRHCKETCKNKPICKKCVLRKLCQYESGGGYG